MHEYVHCMLHDFTHKSKYNMFSNFNVNSLQIYVCLDKLYNLVIIVT